MRHNHQIMHWFLVAIVAPLLSAGEAAPHTTPVATSLLASTGAKPQKASIRSATISWTTSPQSSYTSGNTITISWSGDPALPSVGLMGTTSPPTYDNAQTEFEGTEGPAGVYTAQINAPTVAASTTYYFQVWINEPPIGAPVYSSVVSTTINPSSTGGGTSSLPYVSVKFKIDKDEYYDSVDVAKGTKSKLSFEFLAQGFNGNVPPDPIPVGFSLSGTARSGVDYEPPTKAIWLMPKPHSSALYGSLKVTLLQTSSQIGVSTLILQLNDGGNYYKIYGNVNKVTLRIHDPSPPFLSILSNDSTMKTRRMAYINFYAGMPINLLKLDTEQDKAIFKRLTHVFVAFCMPLPGGSLRNEDGTPHFASGYTLSSSVLREWIYKVHQQGCKVILSIGGANSADALAQYFRRKDGANTIYGTNEVPQNRFKSDLSWLFSDFSFDGINIDYEPIPQSVHDFFAYYLFHWLFHKSLGGENGSSRFLSQDPYEYSACVSRDSLSWPQSQWIKLEQYCEYVSFMAYDTNYDPTTKLYVAVQPVADYATLSANVLAIANSIGVSKRDKIIAGLPFYRWKLDGKTAQKYWEFPAEFRDSQVYIFDDNALEARGMDGSTLVYYHNRYAIAEKTKAYVGSLGCGGVFAWELGQDLATYDLMNSALDSIDAMSGSPGGVFQISNSAFVLNFAKDSQDCFGMQGKIQLPVGFDPNGQQFTITIGSIERQLNLDAKGSFKSKDCTMKLSPDKKSKSITGGGDTGWTLFSFAIKKTSLATSFADYDFRNEDTWYKRRTIPITMNVNGISYYQKVSYSYLATKGKRGAGLYKTKK
jgi:hypothetical protein